MEWASETGGSVIEFHLYTWSQNFDPNTEDSKVWELISPTVKLIYPEIFDRNFKVSKNLFYKEKAFYSVWIKKGSSLSCQ